MDGYKGTSSSDNQGPIPDVAPGTKLTLDTPLKPFKNPDGDNYTSKDCINIETQLGYTYGPGSLEDTLAQATAQDGYSNQTLMSAGIDRALFQGSFVLLAYATVSGADNTSREYYLGHESILSRRNAMQCANCLTHMEVVTHFSLRSMPEGEVEQAEYRIEIQHREAELPVDLSFEVHVNG